MGVPPSLPFFSEVFIIMGIGLYRYRSYVLIFVFLFLSGVFRVFLYVRIMHGKSLFSEYVSLLQTREFLICWGHLFPAFFIPVSMSLFFW